jgi:transcriptional regulator GlxA family with amidase domain
MKLENVYRLAAERFRDRLTIHDLAQAAGMPVNTLTRHFNGAHGVSPVRWLWHFRTVLAAEMIATDPTMSMSNVAGHCGFTSNAHFARRFRHVFGESPSRFRAHCRGNEQKGLKTADDGIPVARALQKTAHVGDTTFLAGRTPLQ